MTVADLPEGITTADTVCPHCGRHNPHHAHPDGRSPADGDVSMCWGCRKVAIYVVGLLGLTLRQPTDEELPELMAAPEVRSALAAAGESYTPLESLHLRRRR